MNKSILKNNVNMQSFLSRHDLVWNTFAQGWDEGAFLGNGFLGALIYNDKSDNNLILSIGNKEVYDNRDGEAKNKLFLTPRLTIGRFLIKSHKKITGQIMRQNLYNACVDATITTEAESITFKSFVASCKDVIFFEWKAKNSLDDFEVEWQPSEAISPRQKMMIFLNDSNRMSKNYEQPKPSYFYEINGVYVHCQPYFNGGGYAVAYKVFKMDDKKRMIVSSVQGDDLNAVAKIAVQNVELSQSNYENILENHKRWWNEYYKKSFVSFSDTKVEGFYWIQLYKIACATRENARVPDTTGPWLEELTSWPGTWWNLNVEITYSPLYTANHLEIANSLWQELERGMPQLINNVPEKYRNDCAALGRCTCRSLSSPVSEAGAEESLESIEIGNLIWTVFYCYTHYRMTMDKEFGKNFVFLILKRAVQYYIYNLYEGADGFLHLPPTASPEYLRSGEDCNYDLSLIRWGCMTLIKLCDELKIADEKQSDWKKILKMLTDYPQDDEKGFYIARGVPYSESHRHFSHILMFYPLHVLDVDNAPDRAKVMKTIEYWQSMPESLEGYSQTGAASMYAMLEDGEKALKHLQKLFDGFIRPNTMYKESGGPVIETPLAAANAILEMLLQSHGDCIKVMPAVANEWQDVVFDNLLAEGGFLVSACRSGGKLKWIRVKSNCGEPCVIKAKFDCIEKVRAVGAAFEYKDGKYYANLERGDEIILTCECDTAQVSPFAAQENMCNYFGMKREQI